MGKRKLTKRLQLPQNEELKGIRTETDAAKLELENIKKEIDIKRGELDAIREVVCGDEQKVKDTKVRVKEIKNEMADVDAEIKKLISLKADFGDEIADMRKCFELEKKEMSDWTEKRKQLFDDNRKHHEMIKNKLINEQEEWEKKIVSATNNYNDILRKSNNLERVIQEKIDKDRVLGSGIENKIRNIGSLDSKIQNLETEIEIKKKAVMKCDENLEALREEEAKQRAEIRDVSQKYDELKKEILDKKSALLAIVAREKKFHRVKQTLEELIKDVGLDIKL